MTFMEYIDAYCDEHYIKENHFAVIAGLTKGQLSQWRTGKHLPNRTSQEKVAAVIGITPEELMHETYQDLYGSSDSHFHSLQAAVQMPAKYIPVYNYIPDTEDPASAIQHIPLTEDELGTSPECFGYIMGDSSMAPRICRGDIIIIKIDPEPDQSDIVVAVAPDSEPLIRKLIRLRDGVILQPDNSHYDAVWYSYDEMEQLPVFFKGKVIRIQRTLRSSSYSVPEDSIL